MVNQDQQFYYCFGCNKGGDVFSFVQEVEGIDFPEALRLLAKKAGVTLQKYDQRAASQKTRLLDLISLATRYWQKILQSNYGQQARKYLNDRGLDEKTINDFKIGYAVDSWDNLSRFLLGRGYNETEIFQAGLSVRKDKGSGYYDRFRDRVVFPIADIHGNIVGFTARALTAEETAKYINTPETSVYHKSSVLYGLDKAKQEIRKKDYMVLVEGNMDVISSYKIGVQNVSAVSGTALTQEQINLIKRFTNNVAFCFDMDEAGQNAAKRSIDLAMKNALNIKIVQLDCGKDPDDCIQKDPKKWEQAIKSAESIMQFYFDKTFSQYNVSDIEEKKKIARILLTQIAKIVNPIEKDHWLKILSQKIDVSDTILREILFAKQEKQQIKPSQEKKDNQLSEPKKKSKYLYLSELLISILLNYPQSIQECADYLSPEMIHHDLQEFYKKIIICYTKNNHLDKKSLTDFISQEDINLEKSYLSSFYVLVDNEYDSFSEKEILQEVPVIMKNIKKLYIQQKIDLLEKQIVILDQEGNSKEMENLIKKLQEYIIKKNKLNE